MKNHFILLILTIFVLSSCGLRSPKISDSDEIYSFPDIYAEFEGGPEALKKYIAESVIYPEISMMLGDQGKVYIEFVVEKDGSISNAKVVRGVSKAIDKEAVRVISEMPNWRPAIKDKKIVRSRCRVPINFVLQ